MKIQLIIEKVSTSYTYYNLSIDSKEKVFNLIRPSNVSTFDICKGISVRQTLKSIYKRKPSASVRKPKQYEGRSSIRG